MLIMFHHNYIIVLVPGLVKIIIQHNGLIKQAHENNINLLHKDSKYNAKTPKHITVT